MCTLCGLDFISKIKPTHVISQCWQQIHYSSIINSWIYCNSRSLAPLQLNHVTSDGGQPHEIEKGIAKKLPHMHPYTVAYHRVTCTFPWNFHYDHLWMLKTSWLLGKDYWKPEPSPESSQQGGFTFVRGTSRLCGGGWHSNLTKIPLIHSVSYFNLRGLEAFWRGLNPPKPPPWRQDCWKQLAWISANKSWSIFKQGKQYRIMQFLLAFCIQLFILRTSMQNPASPHVQTNS